MNIHEYEAIQIAISKIGQHIYETKKQTLEVLFRNFMPNEQYQRKMEKFGLPREMHFSMDFPKTVVAFANEVVKSFQNPNLPVRTVILYWGMESDFANNLKYAKIYGSEQFEREYMQQPKPGYSYCKAERCCKYPDCNCKEQQ